MSGCRFRAAIDAGIAKFGRIDAVVNNAGYGLFGVFELTPEEKVREQFEVNVFGVMNVVRAVPPHFRKSGGGRIVNVSSGAGVFGLPMMPSSRQRTRSSRACAPPGAPPKTRRPSTSPR
jgi:NAD(P)-dependent dehydrogenase (short-subunit alcohol dehydrogenase family)